MKRVHFFAMINDTHCVCLCLGFAMSIKRKAEVKQEHDSKDKKAKVFVDLTKEYSAEVKNIRSSLGRYVRKHGRLHLTELPIGNDDDMARTRTTFSIKISPDLHQATREIVMRLESETTRLLHFPGPFHVREGETRLMFPVRHDEEGGEVMLDFNQNRSNSPDLASQDLSTIHSIKVNFPAPSILGDASVCSICMGDETPKVGERLVTQCGHLFHLSCIFAFFRHNKLVHMCQDCSYLRVKPFQCPFCKQMICESW